MNGEIKSSEQIYVRRKRNRHDWTFLFNKKKNSSIQIWALVDESRKTDINILLKFVGDEDDDDVFICQYTQIVSKKKNIFHHVIAIRIEPYDRIWFDQFK